MFPTINAEYTAAKRADADNALILESVLGEDETLPGSDEEFEEIVDPDSVPADVYARIDKELDRIVGDPSYDDTEAEEMLDDDFDVDDISDAEIDAIMDEAITRMERSEKIAGIVANLSEKAGMNAMARENGMGLLKVLSESVQQFHNDKMEDPIGQAYEPVSTPDKSIDETKLENEALKESAVNRALARFHAIMEEANPDVEDFPGKSGTTQADGDTPAGMPEPNGDEDGSNVGGDDQVVDQEAREVEVEDGGDDAIKVIKANEATGDCAYGDKMNEAVNRYRAIVEKTCPICGEEEGSAECNATCTKEKLKSVIDAAKKKLGRDDTCPKCGLPKDSEACKEQCTDEEREGISKYRKAANEAVTNPDVEDFPGQTGAGNDHGEKEGALPQGQEPADFPNSTGDKKVNSGDDPTSRYKAVAEAATNPIDEAGLEGKAQVNLLNNVERKLAASGKRTPHMNDLMNNKIDSAVNQIVAAHNVSSARRNALDKAAVGSTQNRIAYTKASNAAKTMGAPNNGNAIGAILRHNRKLGESVTNPDVEDFPGREGTDSAEGDAAPRGMEHCDDSCQPAYEDQSAYEQREVGVEDGGTDAIEVIKANEAVNRYRSIAESAKTDKTKADLKKYEDENPDASMLDKFRAGARAAMGKCPKCGKNPCECEC